MKTLLIVLFLSAVSYATEPVETYSNGSTSKEIKQAEEENPKYENRSLRGKQQRMEERRGWKGSGIEAAGSPPLETYDVHPKDRQKD